MTTVAATSTNRIASSTAEKRIDVAVGSHIAVFVVVVVVVVVIVVVVVFVIVTW